jgi:geranylgeranyl diphosphate synthase type II
MQTMAKPLERFFTDSTSLVDAELKRQLAPGPDRPEKLREALCYSIFAGGKRLRPVLVMAAAECCGLDSKLVLSAAAAVEMVHTYSLIHDDLPAMDDDDLRRGKPTNHKVYGEAVAILAGDGLLTLAFEAAAENAAALCLSGPETSALIKALARGAGIDGMVAGQAADLEAEGLASSKKAGLESHLEFIHRHKTAALIIASLECGAILAKASKPNLQALRAYGQAVGLAFQIADDVLDVVGDKAKLGKSGSDAENDKLTYVSLLGVETARKKAQALALEAQLALKPFGTRAEMLDTLARYIVEREK